MAAYQQFKEESIEAVDKLFYKHFAGIRKLSPKDDLSINKQKGRGFNPALIIAIINPIL